MKKLLSILLVVLMIVSSVPFVYAEESNTYKVGDIIQFGSYPQSKVTDSATITALNNKAPAWAPAWDNWTSYGYYSGSGSVGTMKQGDWMRYTDVTYNGNKYRGVKFTQYRPCYTAYSSSSNVQDYNGYSTNTVYWFKFEPIDWRVLDPATGLVMCETIIDSQPYSNTIYSNGGGTYGYFNDSSYTNYANDYETSSIRQWLNNDFYNTAFTDCEKKEINTTTLNNDGYYTSIGTTGYERFDSNSTNDKIFLLSYNEVRNSNFGFDSERYEYDKARQAQGSDYAQSQGLCVYRRSDSTYNNNSMWLLRSPGFTSDSCCNVNSGGDSHIGTSVNYTSFGVRPALRFNRISDIGQSEHQHDYSSVVTSPTCTARGYTTYTCECGDSYVNDYTDKLDHEYTSEITTEPTHLKEGVKTFTCDCGDSYTEVIAKLEGHTYTSEVTKEATHLEEGETTYTCECGDSYTEAIAKLTAHTYNSVVTEPTCTAKGYTTYTCECGDIYVADYTEAKGHIYSVTTTQPTCIQNGLVTTFCTSCGDTHTETLEPTGHSFAEGSSKCENCDFDKADGCSCNCHKGGISGLIFKIILFFQRIFKTNKTCACGVSHY